MATDGTVQVEFLSPETAIVEIAGEHDLSTRERVAAALATARAARNVVVDLSQCTFADTFVITTVLRAWRNQHDAGGDLALVAPFDQGSVRRGIELMGIEGFLPLNPDRATALASLTVHRRLRLTAVSDRIGGVRHRRAA